MYFLLCLLKRFSESEGEHLNNEIYLHTRYIDINSLYLEGILQNVIFFKKISIDKTMYIVCGFGFFETEKIEENKTEI